MSEMLLPTVKIEDPGDSGFRIINESDFDPKVHKKYAEPSAGAASKGSAKGSKGSAK